VVSNHAGEKNKQTIKPTYNAHPISRSQSEKTVKHCFEGVWKKEIKSLSGLLSQQQQMPLKMY